MKKVIFASVHGRFQPFHNGHLNYVQAALKRSEYIYIGITQVERGEMKHFETAPHRGTADANPFSFFERNQLITTTLKDEGIDYSRFSIIPFPIEKENTLFEYLPKGSVCFTTVHSEWNQIKIDLLKSLGYDVVVLEKPDRSGLPLSPATEIRRLLREGDERWKCFVPRKVAEQIEAKHMKKFRP